MASFARFASRAMSFGLGESNVVFQWTLLDTRRAACLAAPGWIPAENETFLVTNEDTCVCADADTVQISAVDHALNKVSEALREVLFQFAHRRGSTGIVRINPSGEVLTNALRRFSQATVPN
jgi:hypothetical protein